MLRRLSDKTRVEASFSRSSLTVSSMLLATSARRVWNSRAVNMPHTLSTEALLIKVTTGIYPSKSTYLSVRSKILFWSCKSDA